MSVVPDDPVHLSYFRRPVRLGGKGNDPVWYLDLNELPPDLSYRPDGPTHGLIEPSRSLTLRAFQEALARTRGLWRLDVP